jgi:LCP family protein required for cell wall assembly
MGKLALPVTVVAGLVVVGLGLRWVVGHDLAQAASVVVVVLLGLLVGAGIAWWQHRRAVAGTLAVVLVLTIGLGGWFAWDLASRTDDIARVPDDTLDQGARPAASTNGAVNILLIGADNPEPEEEKPTVAELLSEGSWNPGNYRSDSVMLMHLAQGGRRTSVTSIPRDSYVPIYDAAGERRTRDKINAAFSEYGPYGTWRTVENLTGQRIDHMAIVDFEGFKGLTDAVGGVEVYIPEDVYDRGRNQSWEQGWQELDGELALAYVRMRYGLDEGDFDRVARQQNFLRTIAGELADDVVDNPLKLGEAIDAMVPYLTVDEGWSGGDIRELALEMRGLRPNRIQYATVPFERYRTIDGVGAANIIDRKRAAELWDAVEAGNVEGYLATYPEDGLGGVEDVS